jgi:hypothetical protein
LLTFHTALRRQSLARDGKCRRAIFTFQSGFADALIDLERTI